MPIFKTTKNIFIDPWNDELYNENWSDSDTLITPPKINWDYKRDIKIEDVDIWEQIYYQGGGLGLYAAWSPYAEFYLITHHMLKINNLFETFYGKNAGVKAYNRAIQLGMPIFLNKIWVEPEDMWLYTD